MSRLAQEERQGLADLFLAVGPAAPTLCAGWTAADLAAHLVVRERRPDAAPGIVIRALAGYTARVQRQVRDSRSWPELVAAVRYGPPVWLRPLDETINTVELFVHHEDVRRAAAGWQPRQLDPRMEAALWKRLGPLSRLAGRKLPVPTTLEAPGYGRLVLRAGEPHVTVTGPPSELVLFVFGRQGAARVEMAGDEGAVAQVREARLGL